MKCADNWESDRIQSTIDTELLHVTLKPHVKEQLLHKIHVQQSPWKERLRFWLDYEIELTVPQVGAAILVACMVLGLYWSQITSVYRVDEAVLSYYRRPLFGVDKPDHGHDISTFEQRSDTMKVRVKVKHLLVIVLCLLATGLAFGQVNENQLFKRAENARLAGQGDESVVLYDRYLQQCVHCTHADEALYWSAVALGPKHQVYGYVFSAARTLVYNRNDIDIDHAESRLKRLIEEFPDSRYSRDAIEQLVVLLTYEGRWSEAEAVLMQAIEREEDEWRTAEYERKRIELAFDQGDLYEAIELVSQYEETWQYHLFDVRLILGDAYRQLGRFVEAQAAYDQAEQAWNEVQHERRLQMGEPSFAALPMTHFYALAERRKLLERELELEHVGGGTVVGRIENYPKAGIMILLGDWAESTLNPESRRRGFPSDGRKLPYEHSFYTALTDADGHFRIDHIPPGEYEIGLRYTPADRILGRVEYAGPMRIVVTDGEIAEAAFRVPLPIHPQNGTSFAEATQDQIRMAWQDVPEAEFYEVWIWKIYRTKYGSETSYVLIDRTDQNDYVLDLATFRWTARGPMPIDEEGRRPPSFILGEYEGEYRFYIEAYRNGEVIATSRVIHNERFAGETFVIADAHELSYEEQLVVEGRFEEAIERFERRLQENPNDLVAAQALFRMYHFGTNERTRAHQDAAKARELAEHIMTLDVDPKVKEYVRTEAIER